MSMKLLRRIKDEVMDVFFPGDCPVCGDPPKMDEGHYACKACLDQIAWVGGSVCRFCGIGMHAIEFQGLTCSNCRKQEHLFHRGKCMFVLDVIGKQIIHEIKYHGAKDVLDDISHWLDRCPGYREFLVGAHLVPVPLHRRRESKRGYNQSLWIAKALKKDLGSAVEVGDFMKRVRNTSTQTKLEKKDRQKNVKNAFALKPGVCLDSIYKIVLIDDVFTTGATLNACTQAWNDVGVSHVQIATLGHG
jgi:competence protein ComFC